nr:DNA topoisomerase 3 [Bacteroidales bacterium]
MIVCIAEKPSVARDIAKVLGANTVHDGYLEGNGYQVTWTFGHLCTLKEPHDYTEMWKPWALTRLPMIPPRFGIKLIADKGVEKQFKVIESLFQKADSIVNCGDAGQEGELIQRWVMQKAMVKCPVQRLWISSLTEESIREGFKSLKDQSDYQSLYEAGLSRAIGDWLLGMNATRLYTLKYGQNRQVLSIGRVQTPTLALIVNRYHEIVNFNPEAYWVLSTVYRDTTFTATKGKYGSVEEGQKDLQNVTGKEFTVTDISTKKGNESPPRLYDLTSLQVECNKHYGFSADQTLQAIQSLYEKKYTTYPRVDTTYLSDDIYPKCPGILSHLTNYAELTAPLAGKKLPKSKKVFDNSKVTDHHAIIPTGVVPQGLSFAESKVYDEVCRHFIAVFYPDCQFATTTVLGKVEEVEFKTSGKQILVPGWREVFAQKTVDRSQKTEEEEKEQEEEKILPAFVKGEHGPHEPQLVEKWTSPPKPYTEATLLRAMETAGKLVDDESLREVMKENGIGRPSTRAAIIETLFKRNYIKKNRKSLEPTPTGIELIGLIHEDLLKSAELTGIWEKKLREIEQHKYEARQFLEELKQMVTEIVTKVMLDTSNRRVTVTSSEKPKKPAAKKTASPKTKKVKVTQSAEPDDIVGQPCPLCGKGHVIKGKTAYGCSEWKNGCGWRKAFFIIAFLAVMFASCSPRQDHGVDFYYWKSNYAMGETERAYFGQLECQRLFVRVFDVDVEDGRAVPVGQIQGFKKESLPNQQTQVIPVVFITNRTFLQYVDQQDVEKLASNVYSAIQHFMSAAGVDYEEIQIDCDWTARTREAYFRFLDALSELSHRRLSCTLRLHQVHDPQNTGVPPVERGSLMCYATSSPLEGMTRNSILDMSLLKTYTSNINDYPL